MRQLRIGMAQVNATVGDLDGNFRKLVETIERSEEHTSELQSLRQLVCRLRLEKKKPRLSSATRRRGRRLPCVRLGVGCDLYFRYGCCHKLTMTAVSDTAATVGGSRMRGEGSDQ